MDKIYSRKRLLIPKLRIVKGRGIRRNLLKRSKSSMGFGENSRPSGSASRDGGGIYQNSGYNKNKSGKLIKTSLIVIIAICIASRIINTIGPTLDVLCKDMAKSVATKISNEQATLVMRKL